jgi:transposase
MRDYTQKTIYIGIDVHKKSYSVAVICEGMAVKKDTIPACPDRLVKYIKKYFAKAKVNTAYEAGFSGFYLHRHLLEHGIKNIVVHPASIEVSARDRVKTDKRDAIKIAQQLADGRLKGIHVPDEQREHFRSVTRLRDRFMEQRVRLGNQLKGLLAYYGLMTTDNNKVSKKWIKKVLELDVSEDVKYCLSAYAEEWFHIDDKLKVILKKLSEQAIEDKAVDNIYRTVPGIGALSARILANELGDMRQFSSAKGLYSFTGLTPSEYSSGEHRWLGRISHQGRSVLRKILVQVSWFLINKDQKMKLFFDEISKRAGKKRAIVAVARKLIGCIRASFLTGEIYVVNHKSDLGKVL